MRLLTKSSEFVFGWRKGNTLLSLLLEMYCVSFILFICFEQECCLRKGHYMPLFHKHYLISQHFSLF